MIEKIDYIAIFKKAWKIIWGNKYLWWFGLFAGAGSFSLNFNLNSNRGGSQHSFSEEAGMKISQFLAQHSNLVIISIVIVILLGIAFFVLGVLSYAGLLKSLKAAIKNEKIYFKKGIIIGRKYFWRLLLIGILASLIILGVIAALGTPIAFLFLLKSYVLAVLITIPAILIFIPIVVLVSFISRYARLYLVLSDLDIRSSLENGYQLFRKNIAVSIIMSLLFIPLGIIAGMALIISILAVALAFGILGLILYFMLSKVGVIIAVVLGSLAIIALFFIFRSIYGAFYHAIWFLFFQEIASIKTEEKAKESVEVIEEKVPEASTGV